MKVWIDLSNSPHPLLFAPVSRELERRGHTVAVTARDNAQTVELAAERWPSLEVVGGVSPAGARAKAAAIAGRVRALRRWAAGERPAVALSHNSYAQIVAARSLGIRAVTAMDYEHQPANHLAFRLAQTILLPQQLPASLVRRQGAVARKVVRYPGLKEEVYLGDFEPDGGLERRLGIERDGADALVVLRTPPARALYHRTANDLWPRVLTLLAARDDVRCVVLARAPEDRAEARTFRRDWVVPDHAVDSRSLVYAADLVVGAGGTMTREAALLGVPTVSIYAGPPPYVDAWLERQGLLRRATRVEDLGRIRPRDREPVTPAELRRRARPLVKVFVASVVAG